MSCFLSHNYRYIKEGTGHVVDSYGITIAENQYMILMVCTKCGKEKVIYGQ